MAGPDWILERERRQAEQILELDMEELQVEEVDDAGSSSSSDVDTFLRNTHGAGGITTPEDHMIDTSLVSLQGHSYLEALVNDSGGRFAFLDHDTVQNLPMFCLQGVVLFPEATLPLRVIQPKLAEAIDKAINHVDAPCMIGVVHFHQHTNDSHHSIASVGTMAKIQEIQQLDDGSSCVLTHGQQRFLLRHRWLDADGVPWGEVRIIEEDTPLRTPRDAFAQLAASNSFRQCVSPIPNLHASYSKLLDNVDSEPDLDSLSPTSTSSGHSISDKRISLSGSESSGSLRCGILDESSSEDEDPMHEQSLQNHGSVKTIGAFEVKHTNSGDEVDLCFTSFKSISRLRKKDTAQQRHYCGTYKSKMASQAPLSFWPRWAYEMYDSYSLSWRAADLWRQVIVNPSIDGHVRKPDLLSFYIASKLPISASLRQELLETDGISYRLRREIELLNAFNIIRCRNCLTFIARRSDMVMTSSDGPIGTYMKLRDHVNEMIIVYNVTGLALRGDPSKAYSWFPGYTWTIALCSSCESNIGWLFTADKKNLHPKSFWAIRTSQVSDDTQSRQVCRRSQ